ncbi:hypothetical protein ACFVT5_21565 [Streptomyces sp. NPDC058001]|uniref:hypothetical protein n=1 Tax=Streptomyces sp. NPDC058001 TaxID=3346300 RepID=UPI0036E95771
MHRAPASGVEPNCGARTEHDCGIAPSIGEGVGRACVEASAATTCAITAGTPVDSTLMSGRSPGQLPYPLDGETLGRVDHIGRAQVGGEVEPRGVRAGR